MLQYILDKQDEKHIGERSTYATDWSRYNQQCEKADGLFILNSSSVQESRALYFLINKDLQEDPTPLLLAPSD